MSVAKKPTASIFVSNVARMAFPDVFLYQFSCRNQNRETVLNMSFGSNGDDWVCPLRKNQPQVFSYQTWPEWPSVADFRTTFRAGTETPNTTLNMSFGSNGDDWVCPLRKNQLQIFSYQTWPEWPSLVDFRTIFRSETNPPKTAVNMSFGSNGDD